MSEIKQSYYRWDYPIPTSKTYWEKFCDDEEKKLVRVRDSFPILSYLSVGPNVRYSETVFRDIVDSDASSARGFDENVPLVDPGLSSPTTPDISLGNDNGVARPNTEPIVKICPPTPLKRPPKSDTTVITETEAEERRTCVVAEGKTTIKRASSYDESRFSDAPSKNSIMPHDGSGDGKVYSKKTCPFHRHEAAVKIFDDDIEKYLIDDPRASVSPNPKLSELLLPRQTPKYHKTEGTRASFKKIRTFALPGKRSKYRPEDDMGLIANQISGDVSKDDGNVALCNKREIKSGNIHSQSDILSLPLSDLTFVSTKESKTTDRSGVSMLFPELSQPRKKIGATLGKLIASSRKIRRYPETVEIRDKLVEEAE